MRLIHQDVINPAIQTIKHPLRNASFVEQLAGFDDEVIKIEPSAQHFAPFIFGKEKRGEGVQILRHFCRDKTKAPFAHGFDPQHELIHLLRQSGVVFCGGFGGNLA